MATERLINDYIPYLFSPLHTLVFGSTLLVYNTHYILKKSTVQSSDLFRWAIKNKRWEFVFFIIGVVMCIVSVCMLKWNILLCCGILGLLSFAYSIPLLPFKNKRRLRDFGWVKILDLALVWTIVTSVLPILYWDKQLIDFPYEIALRFVFIFTLCIAFDIRDMQTDINAGIYTLPNIIGLKNCYRLMDITIAIFAILSIIQFTQFRHVERIVGALLTAIFTKLIISYIRRHPSDRAYHGLVDGLMFMYAMLALLH